MAGETVITVIGNLTADPELRFSPAGSAVSNFTIASTPRTFDRETNSWKDGEPLFLRCSVWREAGENVAESLRKGMRVIAQGRLRSRSYETKEGQRRTVMELEVDEIGPSLRFATASVARSQNTGKGGDWSNSSPQGGAYGVPQSNQRQPQQGQGGGWNAPAADPWTASGGNNQQAGGWGNPGDEPPF